ncbi:MAG: NYN domain-containing protein [candidate division WS1 bacterium]|nr:NYN domain-containing protein [candidate division WS1 bacterium]
MSVRDPELGILRQLAEEIAEIAALQVHAQTRESWCRLNSLQPVKPLVWSSEVCWHEADYEDELTPQTTSDFARSLETELRRQIYLWKHMPGDMLVEPVWYCPLVIHDTGFGIREEVKVARTDEASSVVSRDFTPQIDSEADLEKIQMPVVTDDAEATEQNYQRLVEVLDGILQVEKRGLPWGGIAPWDELIRWWDVEKCMLDLILRPELVHAAMERLIAAYLCRLDQLESQGLLALNHHRTGSGGFGYTHELPQPDYVPGSPPRPLDMWGFATAQIFGDVSPAMHEEFALRYELRWLERFGLNYYGCCEPLHNKVGILRSLPRLRKISISPWADVEKSAEELGREFVFSYKPNPAILAGHAWHPELARKRIREVLEKTQGCLVEIVLKDISTFEYEPQRLWEWSRICSEEAENFTP